MNGVRPASCGHGAGDLAPHRDFEVPAAAVEHAVAGDARSEGVAALAIGLLHDAALVGLEAVLAPV